MNTDLTALREALPLLAAKDVDFAASLLDQGARRPLSDKQMYWVRTLTQRATAPKAAPVVQQLVAGSADIKALLVKAAQNLKDPSIVLDSPLGAIRIALARSSSKYFGGVTVVSKDIKDQGVKGPRARWFGHITDAGAFVPGPKCGAEAQAMGDRLARFAADPVQEAAKYGKLHGRCCFCNLRLRDPRSTAVGYGPDCADNWGMPWG
jgi:hypothetical protein